MRSKQLLHKARSPTCDGTHTLFEQEVSEGHIQSELEACYELLNMIVAGGLIPPLRMNGRRRFDQTGRPESIPMNQGLNRGSLQRNEAEREPNPLIDPPGLIEWLGNNLHPCSSPPLWRGSLPTPLTLPSLSTTIQTVPGLVLHINGLLVRFSLY